MNLAWLVKDINMVFHTRSSRSGLTSLLSLTHVFLALSGHRVGVLSDSLRKWAAQDGGEMGNNSDIGTFL